MFFFAKKRWHYAMAVYGMPTIEAYISMSRPRLIEQTKKVGQCLNRWGSWLSDERHDDIPIIKCNTKALCEGRHFLLDQLRNLFSARLPHKNQRECRPLERAASELLVTYAVLSLPIR
jgi:hypothetical protein